MPIQWIQGAFLVPVIALVLFYLRTRNVAHLMAGLVVMLATAASVFLTAWWPLFAGGSAALILLVLS